MTVNHALVVKMALKYREAVRQEHELAIRYSQAREDGETLRKERDVAWMRAEEARNDLIQVVVGDIDDAFNATLFGTVRPHSGLNSIDAIAKQIKSEPEWDIARALDDVQESTRPRQRSNRI